MKNKQNKILIVLLILSLIIVIVNNIIFSDTPELFQKGFEIGNILSNLSLAYISSYIFYLVVVKYQENNDKKNIYATIYNLTSELVGRGNNVVTTLALANNLQANDLVKYITKEEYVKLCEKTDPNGISSKILLGSFSDNKFNKPTYAALICNNSYTKTNALIDNLFIYMPFLESDFVKLLNKLKDSDFFMIAPLIVNPLFLQSNNDFSVHANIMFDFHLKIKEIDLYIEKNYKKYTL